MALFDSRIDYQKFGLDEADMDADPFRQFHAWLQAAADAQVPEPHAMTLATASPTGDPSARIVLLRGLDARGFTFFTNYESQKGFELAANPRAALVFFWQPLERQVRISGSVEKSSVAESETYFHTRPRGSQLGAWVSLQSSVVADRSVLEHKLREVEAQFAGQEVPLPPYWGGYRVIPDAFEFWQGRPNRLHDRLKYVLQPDGHWRLLRLAP